MKFKFILIIGIAVTFFAAVAIGQPSQTNKQIAQPIISPPTKMVASSLTSSTFNCKHEEAEKPFLSKSLSDPVAIATFLLALATCGLAWFTSRSVLESKRSADIAERAQIEMERPWIFVEKIGAVPRSLTPHPDGHMQITPNDWYINFEIRNLGKTPAILEKCVIGLIDKDNLPAEPNYASASPLTVPQILGVNQPHLIHGPGPAEEVRMKNGSPILYVAFGQIEYKDLSGREHVTGFAVEVSPIGQLGCSTIKNNKYEYFT